MNSQWASPRHKPLPETDSGSGTSSCVTLGKVLNCAEAISPSENRRETLISLGCWNINQKIKASGLEQCLAHE